MNAESDIRAALLAELRGDAAVNALANRVHDGPPAKATPPTVVLGECIGSDWGTKDKAGRELRIGIGIEDDRETAGRIAGLMPLVDVAVHRLTGIVAGWQVGSILPLRSRLARNAAGLWIATMDYRIRVLKS